MPLDKNLFNVKIEKKVYEYFIEFTDSFSLPLQKVSFIKYLLIYNTKIIR